MTPVPPETEQHKTAREIVQMIYGALFGQVATRNYRQKACQTEDSSSEHPDHERESTRG